jgi:hypothetical protein
MKKENKAKGKKVVKAAKKVQRLFPPLRNLRAGPAGPPRKKP